MVTTEFVRGIFKGLEAGNGADFFTHVADDVDCTVMGSTRSQVTTEARRRSWRPLSPSSTRCFGRWVVEFRNDAIVRVRAYLDSAMVARLFEQNPL